jgi:hypothetical protein
MEQMGANCFSLNGLGGILEVGFAPETACPHLTISGQIGVDFR